MLKDRHFIMERQALDTDKNVPRKAILDYLVGVGGLELLFKGRDLLTFVKIPSPADQRRALRRALDRWEVGRPLKYARSGVVLATFHGPADRRGVALIPRR